MLSMTKSKELDEEQRQDADVNKRYYAEDVTFYQGLDSRLKEIVLTDISYKVANSPNAFSNSDFAI